MIDQKIEALIQKFQNYPSWEERYNHIIKLGKELPEMDVKYKVGNNLVKGCQSQVWLFAELDPEGKIRFQADSDALIVKGLVAVLMILYNGHTPEEILKAPVDVLAKFGFQGHLSPSRANGLVSMIKQIRNYAIAYQAISQNSKN